MLRTYLKIAWRNLMKSKAFSFINVFGLAIGLTCCMLITVYLHHETSYDSHHANIADLYQVGTIFVKPGNEDITANTPSPMAKAMQQEFPEIKQTARLMELFSEDKTLLQYRPDGGDMRSFYETRGFMADSTFFRMFTYKFKEGDPKTSLEGPLSLVVSEEIAAKLFGKEPALNKIVRISSNTNGDFDFRVTGVFIPSKLPSHIDARFFLSFQGGGMSDFINTRTELASNNMFYTYLQLAPGADAKKLERQFPAFIDKYAGKDLKALGFYKKQFLVPVKDVHLYSKIERNVSSPGNRTSLYILASIAVFTLLIACINFMNLSTARSSKRSAEVGVRKVLGAEKQSLIRQFLGESVLMALIALVFAIIITKLLLPFFGELSGKSFSLPLKNQLILFGSFVGLGIVTGLIAGSYPAFYLSSFAPVKVLKGRFSNTMAAISLRKVLVVFQFAISVVLIIASVVISRQMKYLYSKDLGFTKEQQVVIPLRSNIAKRAYTSFKSELERNPRIISVGASFYYPGIFNPSDMPLYKEGANMAESKRVYMNYVDNSFLQTLDIKPVAGRLFSKAFPADTNARMVLNETAVRQLGFESPAKAVGKFAVIEWQGQTYKWEIIGVTKDFHFQKLHLNIEPYGFQLINNPQFSYAIAHSKPGDIQATLKSIAAKWHRVNPNEPFDYSFLDQDFNKGYAVEVRLASLVGYFTVIAILISCLGLFGLAMFSAEQRTREIGIRKVLGSSVSGIITLLSKDFLKLVGIAILIASPLAWYIMNTWLQEFAYKTNISWEVFLITSIVAITVALVTISFQAIRAAIANPVKSLRTE